MGIKVPYMVLFLVRKVPYMVRFMTSYLRYEVRFMISRVPEIVLFHICNHNPWKTLWRAMAGMAP